LIILIIQIKNTWIKADAENAAAFLRECSGLPSIYFLVAQMKKKEFPILTEVKLEALRARLKHSHKNVSHKDI
jgi:hypothetical protein